MATTTWRQCTLLAGMATALIALNACGAAEEPTPTPRPAAPSTPTSAPAAAATATPTPVRAVASPTPTATPTPAVARARRGGTLRLGYGTQYNSFDPALLTVGTPGLMTPIFNGLTRLDETGTILPGLAASWDVSPTAVTFRLQPGAKFHDGTEFNARAVKFNMDRILDPNFATIQRIFLANVASVEAVDNLTVRFNMKRPDAVLLTNLADRLGLTSSPTAVQSMGISEYGRKPVGTGPFKLKEWVTDSHLTFEAFSDYWEKGLPNLDEIRVRLIPDTTVSVAALRARDIDWTTIRGDQYRPLEKVQGLVLFSGPCQCTTSLEVHRAKKPTDDVRVRRAMSMALNREALVNTLLDGRGRPIWGPVAPGFAWAFRPDLKKYDYNLAEAKKLMAEAGYPNGFKLGPVVFISPASRRYAVAYAGMLKEIGIDFDILEMEASQASVGYQVEHKFAAYSTGYGGHVDPSVPILDRYYPPEAPKNVGHTAFPGLKEAIEASNSEYDRAKRAKLLQQSEDILVDNMAAIWTFSTDVTEAWLDRVRDYKPHPGSLPYWAPVWLER